MWAREEEYSNGESIGYYNGIERTNRSLTRWIIFSVILFVYLVSMSIFGCVKSGYEWELLAGSHWQLADRSSTLEAKSQYVNSFVIALESMNKNGMLSEYNALFLKTPQNKTQNNINAIKTLQNRLEEVSLIDSRSFEYNQSILQITGQEQGESQQLIDELVGAFLLGNNYWYVWNWAGITIIVFEFILFFVVATLIIIRLF